LGLLPVGDALVSGFRGPEQAVETYSLTLILHNWTFTEVKVIASDESYVLLGRDVLKHLSIA
jgi:hypothetical protein